MQHSSRKDPCVICGRNTDDKCRKSSTRIYCYVGDSFSPPLSLRIGDKLKIAGETWRLFSHASGFSQNSYAFALDEGENYRFLSYEDKRLFRKNCIKLTRIFLQKEKTIDSTLLKIAEESHFQSMTLDKFYANKLLIQDAIAYLVGFADFSFTNKRYLIGSGADIDRPKALAKQLQDNLKIVYEFEKEYLGNARPEESNLRARQFVF